MYVHDALVSGDIPLAKTKLSYIVGRDTKNLSYSEIAKAAVETVAENLSDGVIAPLFYVLLGGVPLGYAYKAINTLDSMIGYRNKTFVQFGKFAARLDDVVNWIPARLSALLMLAVTPISGGGYRNALRIFLRDRRQHSSPNSGQTEAVCAGALGLQLGGTHAYGGVLVEKPTLGDPMFEAEAIHISRANRLMYAAASLLVLCICVGALIGSICHG